MEAPPKHPKTAALFAALLNALDISASQLAKAISTPGEEYSQQVVSNYVAGKFKPGQEMLAAISRRYPSIDAKWLLTGKGEPFPTGRYNEKTSPDPATKGEPATLAADSDGGSVLSASQGGLPIPGQATPQQADFVGRLIKRLEDELDASKTREGYWQDRAERLEKPSPTVDATWLPETRTELRMRPTACIATPDAKAMGGKVLAMYPAQVARRAQG